MYFNWISLKEKRGFINISDEPTQLQLINKEHVVIRKTSVTPELK